MTARWLTIALLGACGGSAAPAPPAPQPSPPSPSETITPTAEGALTPDHVNRVVHASKDALRACYQDELDRDPELGNGRVVVRFEIAVDGSVSSARILDSSTLDSDAVETCVAEEIRRLTFPPATAGTVATYPFLFSHG